MISRATPPGAYEWHRPLNIYPGKLNLRRDSADKSPVLGPMVMIYFFRNSVGREDEEDEEDLREKAEGERGILCDAVAVVPQRRCTHFLHPSTVLMESRVTVDVLTAPPAPSRTCLDTLSAFTALGHMLAYVGRVSITMRTTLKLCLHVPPGMISSSMACPQALPV